VKNWWRKWTHEVPLAISDGLWDVCVVQFAAFLSRLTPRRIIEFIAIAILAMAFAQTLPLDLALLVAGDVTTYLELTALVWLLAGRDNVLAAVRFIRQLGPLLVRVVARGTSSRRREPRNRIPPWPSASAKRSDDDGQWAGALCPA
jgi:hypothetical protein